MTDSEIADPYFWSYIGSCNTPSSPLRVLSGIQADRLLSRIRADAEVIAELKEAASLFLAWREYDNIKQCDPMHADSDHCKYCNCARYLANLERLIGESK